MQFNPGIQRTKKVYCNPHLISHQLFFIIITKINAHLQEAHAVY